MIPGIPEKPKFYKNPWVIGASLIVVVILLIAGALVPSFKQTISLLKTENTNLKQAYALATGERDNLRLETSKLREQVNKTASANKYLKEWYENGNLKKEEGETSASSETTIRELQSQLSDATKEVQMLTEWNKDLSSQLAVKYDKETERRGDIGIVAGGVALIEPFSVKPIAGVDARLFDFLGISFRAGLFVSR